MPDFDSEQVFPYLGSERVRHRKQAQGSREKTREVPGATERKRTEHPDEGRRAWVREKHMPTMAKMALKASLKCSKPTGREGKA